jgi:hypothetical protein
MSASDDKSTYEALDIPDEARERGGVEILRAGMMSDELFVAARAAFDDPAMWGEVLADVTRRIARLYAAGGKYTHKDALVAIESAFAADLGAPVAAKTPRKGKRGKLRAKPRAKTTARKSAKRKVR